jgi:uncharacterized delta-60 repeat protein
MQQPMTSSTARTLLVTLVGILLYSLLTFIAAYAANDGALDASFDGDGIVTTDFGNADLAYAVATQSDDKILVAGYTQIGQSFDFVLARYLPDGSLDTSFGASGKAITDFFGEVEHASAIAVQPDGKIVVTGLAYHDDNIDFALARYTVSGALDVDFGGDGKVTTAFGDYNHGQAIAIQNDGKLVVAGLTKINGQYDFAVARYLSDGNLDATFGSGGKVITDLGGDDYGYSLAIQPDDKLVVAGYTDVDGTWDVAIVRYHPNGSLDTTFGDQGVAITDLGYDDYGYSLALQTDGRITVAGLTDTDDGADFVLVRYLGDGSLDALFGSGGKVITDLGGDDRGYSLGLQSDGRLVVAGQVNFNGPYDFGLARYLPNGALDSSMGAGGIVITDIGDNDLANALVIQSDGHVVVAGYTNISGNADIALARYYGNGMGPDLTPVSTFTPPATTNPTPTATLAPPTPTPTLAPPTPTPTISPGDVEVNLLPDQPATLRYLPGAGCTVRIEIPAGAVSEATTLRYHPLSAPTYALGEHHFAGLAFELSAYRNNALVENFVFNLAVTLTIQCPDVTMAGLDETKTQLLVYRPTNTRWTTDGVLVIEQNLAAHRLVTLLDQVGEFALVAPLQSNTVYLPVVASN